MGTGYILIAIFLKPWIMNCFLYKKGSFEDSTGYPPMHNIIRFVPNILSGCRLILAVLFPFSPEKYWIWLIIAGGGSDFLDGWIARHWEVTSWQGRVLDAVADKLFILSVLLTFVLSGKMSVYVVPAIIARDLVVVVIAGYTHYCRAWDAFRRIKSRWSGKIATAGQFLLLVVVTMAPGLIPMAILIAITLSISAAIDYSLQFLVALRLRSETVS